MLAALEEAPEASAQFAAWCTPEPPALYPLAGRTPCESVTLPQPAGT